MISVNVLVDHKKWKKSLNKPQLFFDKILRRFPKKYTFSNKKVNFTLLLSNNTNIKKLNNKFRKRNKPTDVLSFPAFSKQKLKSIKNKKIYIGDIVTSYEIINSRSVKKNFFVEFDKVWVHGLLHLIGYDHIRNKDFYKMNKIEKRILNSI